MKRSSPLLLLLALLGFFIVSQLATAAASPARPTSTFAHPTVRDDEAEAEEEELKEGCGDDGAAQAAKKGAPFVTAPAACQVRQAESTITTLPASDQVRLTVRYQTYSPTSVTVGLKLKDHKGAVAIEPASKHLSGRGVLHLTTKLGSTVMDRAVAASEFDVSLRAPETPDFCADTLEQRLLSVKHTSARAPRVYAD